MREAKRDECTRSALKVGFGLPAARRVSRFGDRYRFELSSTSGFLPPSVCGISSLGTWHDLPELVQNLPKPRSLGRPSQPQVFAAPMDEVVSKPHVGAKHSAGPSTARAMPADLP